MRFGKLLAAVTEKSRANEPYVSYKELKRNISKVHAACGLQDDAEPSSGDEGPGFMAQERLESQAASSSSSHVAASSSSANPRVVGPQEDFFNLINQDVTAAKLYVQSTVSGLEAMLGEFQVAAVKAGLLFTPQQLEEVSWQLPAPMDQEALVEWLLSLRPGAKTREERSCLVEKYSEIARRLNALLQYVEVNLTAVRKILKKFDKKVPAEFRVRKTQDYKEHHELFMISMQYVLVTAVQMQRLIAERVVDSEPLAVPVSQLGPESLAVLALATGPAVVDDVLGRVPATRIDVYAKPAGVGAAEPPTPIPAKPQAKPVPSVLPRKQQAGLVSRSPGSAPADEDDGDDDAPENQEPSTTGKTRRRGGRNNRKRGARRDSDPQPQPQQPQGQPMQPQQATQVHQGPPKGAKGSAKAKSQPKGRSTEAGQPVLAAGPVATERKSDFRPEYTQSPMAQLLLQQPMQCRGSPPVMFQQQIPLQQPHPQQQFLQQQLPSMQFQHFAPSFARMAPMPIIFGQRA